MVGEGHENTVYELSGRLMTQEEFATVLSDVLGKDIPVQQVDDATFAEMMKGAGVPEAYIPMLVKTQKGFRNGALEVESNDLEKLLGRPVTPAKEALTQIIDEIRKSV
ncbi:uncharacterized protein YbjT (DUF2867 family) [Paenibacillus sp. RC73]